MNRREVLAGLVGAAGTALAAAPAIYAGQKPGKTPWPWTPRKMDPEQCAHIAYDGYWKMGCGYGTFVGLMKPLADKYGAPYSNFPIEITSYMAGGTGGWGTLCGALNAAAAFFGLFWPFKQQVPMVDALYSWYEQANLPEYKPAKPKVDFEMVQTVSHSPLCHQSSGLWCKESGYDMHSKQRAERCARVAAQVAQHSAVIINAKLDDKKFAFPVSESRKTCTQCHAKGKEVDDLKTRMDCMPCHGGQIDNKFEGHF